MKKIIFLLFLTITLPHNAQTFECDFQPEALMYNTSSYTAQSRNSFTNNQPIVFNVKFHILLEENGTEPYGVNENKLLEHIAHLNKNFNKFNLFYKYRGFEEHSGIITYQFGNETITGPIYNAPSGVIYNHLDLVNNNPNSINVLLTRDLYPGANANFTKQRVTINASRIMNIYGFGSMAHEFGHLAGLLHIFEGTKFTQRCAGLNSTGQYCVENTTQYQPYTDFNNDGHDEISYAATDLNTCRLFEPGQNGYGNNENVTRDTNNPNFNADVKGDMIIDTPAQFLGSQYNYYRGTEFYYLGIGFYYISQPNIVDEVGEMYVNIDVQNFMSYSEVIMTNFTNGQGVRMRETINNNPGTFDRVKASVASLYEPYKIEEIETISNDIYSLTDNGDGTAEVCRTRSFEMKHSFQPGFDYDFYGYGMSNFDHHVDKTDLYGILDTGYYKFLKINQISDTDIIIHENTVCDLRSGVVCVTEPYSKGNVLSSTNLANPNPTIKVLNSQEASDPNLEQNLENNQFHIIEKTTISGAKIQKTIYKNGN